MNATTHPVWPPDRVRSMGTYVLASKGSGKSRLLGRVIAKQDLLRGVPQVILDPVGGTIDNLLDCILRLPPEQQQIVWPRVVYADMGAQDYVIPMPIYYRLASTDTLYQMSQRFLDVIRILDPQLQSAAMEGLNALLKCGTNVGMALAGLDAQITEATALLSNPKQWQAALKQLPIIHPDAKPAVAWLLGESEPMSGDLRMRRVASFLQKVAMFNYEAATRAMFGADQPGFDWQQVVEQGQTLLIDFRNVHEIELRRWKMAWTLFYFRDYVQYRGAGRHKPLALMIDEVSPLTNLDQRTGTDLFAGVFDELLQVWGRQGQLWLTFSHQEIFQISQALFNTLMGCGTKIIGKTSNLDSAVQLARELIPLDPHRVKRYEPVYGADSSILRERPITYTLDEQQHLAARLFKGVGKFRFLVQSVSDEGGIDLPLRPLSIEQLEPGIYPNELSVAHARDLLRRKSGRPVNEVLNEIEARQQRLFKKHTDGNQVKSSKKPDTLKTNEPAHEPQHDPSPERGEDELWN